MLRIVGLNSKLPCHYIGSRFHCFMKNVLMNSMKGRKLEILFGEQSYKAKTERMSVAFLIAC